MQTILVVLILVPGQLCQTPGHIKEKTPNFSAIRQQRFLFDTQGIEKLKTKQKNTQWILMTY